MPNVRGRPRKASPEILQEAAFELFQVHGYRGTSVEQIARTAGFSRATFFNFFASKSDLYWLETDALMSGLAMYLEQSLDEQLKRGEVVALEHLLLEYSASVSSADIPWALQNFRILESADDLIAAGAGRVVTLNRMLDSYLQRSEPGQDFSTRSAHAAVLTALMITALRVWIGAGVNRGSLREQLAQVMSGGVWRD